MADDSKMENTGKRQPASNWICIVAMIATVAATSMVVETTLARAASNDTQLLRDAQRVFKPLPKDALHPSVSSWDASYSSIPGSRSTVR